MIKTTFCLIALILYSEVSAQEICCQDLSPDQLMVLAIDKAKRDDRLKQERLIYNESYTRREFDYKGILKSTEGSTTILQGKARKLAGFDLEIGGLLEVLRDRHNFSFSNPKETIFGQTESFVLEFRPKDSLRDSTTEDKFINRLRGKVIIDAKDQSLLHVEGRITEADIFDFRAWWKSILFVTVEVQNFSLIFDQVKYEGMTVEDNIEVTTKFKVLGSTRSREYKYQYGNYRIR